MPFIALDKNNRKRIDITQFDDPKMQLEGMTLVCQLCDCGLPMSIKASEARLVSPHFFHIETCGSDYKSHPESPEHRSGKEFVTNWVCEKLENYSASIVEKEFPIPEIKRVIDVVVIYPFGWIWANEIQLAKTTVDDLERRTSDYLSAGIDVIWWLGKGADSPALRNWCVQKYGFSPYLRFISDTKIETGYWFEYYFFDSYAGRQSKIIRWPHDKDQMREGDIIRYSLGDSIVGWWIDTVFNRYFQVWERGNSDLFRRGILAKKKLIKSFFGKIGCRHKLFNKTKNEDHKNIIWNVDWEAYLDHETRYKGIPILCSEAVKIVKRRAHEKANNRTFGVQATQ